MWIQRTALAGGFVAVLAAVAPFVSRSLSTEEVGPRLTHKIQRGELSVTVTENGTVESSDNKEIKCFVKGGSTVLWVIETGTIVKPGDEVVRLDDSLIEENITRQQITVERAIANQIIAESEVDVAVTNIEEYKNGTFLEEKSAIEKEIFDAQERVKKAQLSYESAERMVSKGMFGTLQLEGEKFAVDSARKDLEMKVQRLATLETYKQKKTMQGLVSAMAAAKARLAAEDASLQLEMDRLERDKEQLKNCVITADAAGMVIFPSAAEWKETPDIEEGAMVREQQTLLMIPDVSKMQVKVGIHESKVDQLSIGMAARVQLQDLVLEGEVESVAEVTRPAGWWTGNMVKYDTVIKLESRAGLKPGMSAVVDVVLARHPDVLKIPVAAIVEGNEGFLCWVDTGQGVQRRKLELGDSNDEFTVVNDGLIEGDLVVLNPLASIDEAQREALRSTSEPDYAPPAGVSAKDKTLVKKPETKAGKTKQAESTITGTKLVAMGDKNADGVLTEDEFAEMDQGKFASIDTNGDGKVDAGELDVTLKAAEGT
jgi:HlyD family secretion protein